MEKRYRMYFIQMWVFIVLDFIILKKPDIFGLSEIQVKLFLPAFILGEISFILLQESIIYYKITKKEKKMSDELFYFLLNITVSLKKGVTNFITLFYYTDTKHFSEDFQKEIEKLRRKVNIYGVYKPFKELIEKWKSNPDIRAIRGPFLSILKTQQFNSLQSLIDAVKIKKDINEIIRAEMAEMNIMMIGGAILLAVFPPVFRKIAGSLPSEYFYYVYFMVFSFIFFIGGVITLISIPERSNRIRILTFLFVIAVLSYTYLVFTTPLESLGE